LSSFAVMDSLHGLVRDGVGDGRPEVPPARRDRPAGTAVAAHAADRGLLDAALAGDPVAVRALVDHLAPTVQARVTIALVRRAEARGRSLRAEIEDLAQDVFARLFENRGACLRTWRPDAGLSLKGFVGLVAQRQAGAALRTDKRNPFTESATEPEALAGMASRSPPGPTRASEAVESKELLDAVIEGLRARLSEQGFQLFRLLYVDELSVEEVGRRAALSAEAVYAWRSRIGRMARELREQLLASGGAPTAPHPGARPA